MVDLPDLDIENIKAKIDTGARTSSLHAFDMEPLRRTAGSHVRFKTWSYEAGVKIMKECKARIIDIRQVKDSGAHIEERIVIETSLRLGERSWMIELTLTDREEMLHDMLIGRSSLPKGVLINPRRTLLQPRSD